MEEVAAAGGIKIGADGRGGVGNDQAKFGDFFFRCHGGRELFLKFVGKETDKISSGICQRSIASSSGETFLSVVAMTGARSANVGHKRLLYISMAGADGERKFPRMDWERRDHLS